MPTFFIQMFTLSHYVERLVLLRVQISYSRTCNRGFEGVRRVHVGVNLVKLDTVSESLLSEVSKVLVGEDLLYVLPLMVPRVFIFSKEEKYIHSLKRG